MPFTLTIFAVFLSVALAAGVVMNYVLTLNAPGRKRLRSIANTGGSALVVERNASGLMPSLTPGLNRLAMFIPKSPKDMSRIQKRMAKAGYHGLGPALVFAGAELLIPVL